MAMVYENVDAGSDDDEEGEEEDGGDDDEKDDLMTNQSPAQETPGPSNACAPISPCSSPDHRHNHHHCHHHSQRIHHRH